MTCWHMDEPCAFRNVYILFHIWVYVTILAHSLPLVRLFLAGRLHQEDLGDPKETSQFKKNSYGLFQAAFQGQENMGYAVRGTTVTHTDGDKTLGFIVTIQVRAVGQSLNESFNEVQFLSVYFRIKSKNWGENCSLSAPLKQIKQTEQQMGGGFKWSWLLILEGLVSHVICDLWQRTQNMLIRLVKGDAFCNPNFKLRLEPFFWGTLVGPTVKQTRPREDDRICVRRSSNVIGLISSTFFHLDDASCAWKNCGTFMLDLHVRADGVCVFVCEWGVYFAAK